MSGGEWRRGGDPENPPIDRVGKYKARWANSDSDGFYSTYVFHDLRADHGTLEGGDYPLGQRCDSPESFNWRGDIEWRYVGPIEPGSSKGGGEARRQELRDEVRLWNASQDTWAEVTDRVMDFIEENPTAVMMFLGQTELASQLEEARQRNSELCLEWAGRCDALKQRVAELDGMLIHQGRTLSELRSRLSAQSEGETEKAKFSDIDILRSSAKYMDARVTELEKWRERVCQ